MFRWIKQHKKASLLTADAVLVLLCVSMKMLSEWLLANTNTVCDWTKIGAQCLTCGGTHFVKAFLNFRFAEAFHQNELLFFTAVYLIVSLVWVHLLVWFELPFAKTALKWMYNIPVLILYVIGIFLFLILRNTSTIVMLYHFLQFKLSQDGGFAALLESLVSTA